MTEEELQTGGHDGWFDQHLRRQILKIKPKKIFDVGAGQGLNAKLIRETMGNVMGSKKYLEINGIEVFEPLIEQSHKYYNVLRFDDITKLDKVDWEYFAGDLIIFGDVIEHIEKVVGIDVLKTAMKHFKYIIINTPLGFLEHPAMDVNKHEEHISAWNPVDFIGMNVVDHAIREEGAYAGLFTVMIKT